MDFYNGRNNRKQTGIEPGVPPPPTPPATLQEKGRGDRRKGRGKRRWKKNESRKWGQFGMAKFDWAGDDNQILPKK
jgi:hypothetical protein